MWDAQVALLGDAWKVWTPDLPGFGGSPLSEGWRLDSVAHDLLDIADQNGFDRFGVVGLSMGSYTALELYRQAPARVRFLVLADGRARDDSPPEREARNRMISEIGARGSRALAELTLPRLLSNNPVRPIGESVRDVIGKTAPEAMIAALEALRERRDSTKLLGEIHCPTLVLGGNADLITPPHECRDMAAAIEDARFVEIPNAGHLSNLENPEAFNRALEEFLQSL